MIRVCLADDHAIVREGVRRILAPEADIQVCGEARNGRETLEILRRSDCDVLVLDITMPAPSGVRLIRLLLREHPELAILILSMHGEDQYAVRTIRAGARGYLVKTATAPQLVSAIRRVAAGRMLLNTNLSQKLALNVLTHDGSEPHRRLSRQEYRVFFQLVNGRTVGEVASELGVSSRTVSTHKSRLLRKMELDSVAALVRYAIDHGLVEAG